MFFIKLIPLFITNQIKHYKQEIYIIFAKQNNTIKNKKKLSNFANYKYKFLFNKNKVSTNISIFLISKVKI